MKKYIIAICLFFLLTHKAFSQLPSDVIRNNWFPNTGTAKFNALAGSISSVGADLSAGGINPAGLAFFKKTEFVISINNFTDNYKNTYLGTVQNYTINNSSKLNFLGIVIPLTPINNSIKNSVISFTFNKLADFNTTVQYSSNNNFGSLTQKYVEQLKYDVADTNAAFWGYRLGASLAFRNYLIDTSITNGYKTLVPLSANKLQSYKVNSQGYSHEYSFGWAGEFDKIVDFGISIVIPVFSYKQTKYYREEDLSGNTNNNFSYFNFFENYNSFGTGIGAKLGIIVKPSDRFRFGFSIHSPQTIHVTEDIYATLVSNNEGYTNNKPKFANSDEYYDNTYTNNYYYTSPTKLQLSSSYFWGNLKNKNTLKGFVSGELEYINYAGASYSTNNDGVDDGYYDELNNTIYKLYRNNTNIKLGTEFSYYGWRLRLGYANYGSPYKDANVNHSKTLSSLGIGFRAKNSNFDISFSKVSTNTYNYPYYLDNGTNNAANINVNTTNVTFTYTLRF